MFVPQFAVTSVVALVLSGCASATEKTDGGGAAVDAVSSAGVDAIAPTDDCMGTGCAPPSCEASITPSSGTPSSVFTATWSSDGTSCTWRLDGVDQGAVDCAGMATLTLPAGSHKVTLVATGQGGTASCDSNTVTVSAAPPTCTASISPSSGTTTTTFTASWESDGTSCSWQLDGADQGAVDCAGTATATLAAGSHKVTLVAMGPGGTVSCDSNTVTVSAALPTCAASMSPTTGTTATTFTATWSSNGTACSWKLDGVDQGAVGCSGTYASTLPAGNHRVTLVATGPGGTVSCDSNTVTVSVPLPTCSASISPGSGTTSSTFTANWSSDGTSCSWKFDGVHQGSVACSGSFASELAAGSHYVTLVATGPGGTRSCDSNTVSVSP